MVLLAAAPESTPLLPLTLGVVIFLAVGGVVFFWWEPLKRHLRRREATYELVLRGRLLMDVRPRSVTVGTFVVMGVLAITGYALFHNVLVAAAFGAAGALLPWLLLRYLKRRRLYKLEDQLVDGIQTLSSGVRAGLNLIQAMQLLGDSGVRPISDEFAHLIREYEHGVPVERAMRNAVARIQSSNYRLLFSALLTHRERGGDLGETLDRIADSIREIRRLEKRIETLTAPGRAAARWMGVMPAVILAIVYFFIDDEGVRMLWTEDWGKVILAGIIFLNVVGFLWIRRIVAIDI